MTPRSSGMFGLVALVLTANHVGAVVTKASQSVTPVEKVIELLTKLDTQIEEEGKREAAQYDKYACFCKEQADNKLYAIERSQKKEKQLTETIDALEADILELNGEIQQLGIKITGVTHTIGNKTKDRAAEHDTYLVNDKEVSDAIDACERAIEALSGSKGDLAGKVAMEEESLVQLKKVATLAFGMSGRSSALLSASQWDTLSHLAKAGQPGEAYDYTYHSNDIIATLESLRLTFKKEKQDLYDAEFEAKTMFDKEIVDLSNEKAFAEKDKLAKEKREAFKTEQKEKATEDFNAEVAAREADQSFMEVLKADCAAKAELFDKRSQTRTEEVTALSQAMNALKTGVVPNWKANRKLVGLQKKPAVVRAGQAQPVAFVQLRGSANRDAAARKDVVASLQSSASRLHSSVLAVLALKVQSSEDHFVKVRSMINDIIARLEGQAAAEATTKQWCDKNMKNAVDTRDAEQAKVEDFKAQISQNEADKAQLLSDIAALSNAISESQKALLEATELRAEEKKDNEMVISQAGAGRDAVEYALKVLEDFYNPLAAIQVGYVPPNSDRDGNTLGDLAPEYHTEEYKGSQKESKGIIGMLQVILADFDRTDTVVTGQEGQAADDFNTYKTKTEEDIRAMQSDVKQKNDQVDDINDDLVTLKGNLKTATATHKDALDELETLRTTCVEGEETYEERVAKRQKEIEALKEAHAILENWQS